MILCEYYFIKLGKSKLIKYFYIEYFETADCKKLFAEIIMEIIGKQLLPSWREDSRKKKQYEMILFFLT